MRVETAYSDACMLLRAELWHHPGVLHMHYLQALADVQQLFGPLIPDSDFVLVPTDMYVA
jgi:hypothetical protein